MTNNIKNIVANLKDLLILYLKHNNLYEKNLKQTRVINRIIDGEFRDLGGAFDAYICNYRHQVFIAGKIIEDKQQRYTFYEIEQIPSTGIIDDRNLSLEEFNMLLIKNDEAFSTIMGLNDLNETILIESSEALLLKEKSEMLDEKIRDLEEKIYKTKLKAELQDCLSIKKQLNQQLNEIEDKKISSKKI